MDKPCKEIMDVLGVSADEQRKRWSDYAMYRFAEMIDAVKSDQGQDWKGVKIDDMIEQIACEINTDSPDTASPATVRAWLAKFNPDKFDAAKIELRQKKKEMLAAKYEKAQDGSIDGILRKLEDGEDLSVAELCKIEKHAGDRAALLRGDSTQNVKVEGGGIVFVKFDEVEIDDTDDSST